MSKGRRVPPAAVPVLVLPEALPGDPSQDVDGAYFRSRPAIREYVRSPIAGEFPEPLPHGTKIVVRRIGQMRMRAICPPDEGLN